MPVLRVFTVVLMLLISCLAWPAAVQSTVLPEISIEFSNCSDFGRTLAELEAWTKRVEGHEFRPFATGTLCEDKPNTPVRMNIARYLPRKVVQAMQQKHLANGLNCWNFSLVASGLLKHFRFTGEPEFTFAVDNSGFCEKVPRADRRAGDLVAIRVKRNETITELHAYVFLNSEHAIQKRGSLTGYPYERANPKDIYQKFAQAVQATCETCVVFEDYYRCTPRPSQINPRFQRKLEAAECAVEQNMFSVEPTIKMEAESLRVLGEFADNEAQQILEKLFESKNPEEIEQFKRALSELQLAIKRINSMKTYR